MTLTSCGLAGCSTKSNVNYIVVSNLPPVAAFSASPTNGMAPLVVAFADASTGAITNRFWDFGDSGTTNTMTNSVAHTYTSAGDYTVTLTVSGPGGVSSSIKTNLITVAEPLSAFLQWQLDYFGCTNLAVCPQAAGDADPDGDGMSNTNEFLTGTNPTNGVSAFRIISVVRNGADVVVTWNTAGVRTNALQAMNGGTDGYATNGFQDVSGAIIIPASGDTTTNYTDIGGATNEPSRFYRIRLVTDQVITDTDGDGIPDAWMEQYFGHPTGQAEDHSLYSDDADGDGLSNLAEYLSGTDPTNSVSALRIIAALQTNDDIVVTWSTAGGYTNALQVTNGDAGSYTNNFTDLPASQMIIAGSGDTSTNYVDAGGATNTPSRFYRVRLVP